MTSSHSSSAAAHNHGGHDQTGGGQVAAGHGKPSYDDVNVPVLFMVVVISALITALIVAFVQGLAYRWENYYLREQVYGKGNRAVTEIIDGQKANLLNSDNLPGRISIDQAKEKVLSSFGASQANSSGDSAGSASGDAGK